MPELKISMIERNVIYNSLVNKLIKEQDVKKAVEALYEQDRLYMHFSPEERKQLRNISSRLKKEIETTKSFIQRMEKEGKGSLDFPRRFTDKPEPEKKSKK